jgi:hypothetical protein
MGTIGFHRLKPHAFEEFPGRPSLDSSKRGGSRCFRSAARFFSTVLRLNRLYLRRQGGPQMTESLEAISKLIDECPDEERRALKLYFQRLLPHPLEREWGIDADTILSAISRSSDLTKRGVRGIIAEAIFVSQIMPTVAAFGWLPVDFSGDHSYDALLKKGDTSARIQVKLQRPEEGVPKLYYPKHYQEGSLFVVEVQKTRTGKKPAKKTLPGTQTEIMVTGSATESTRPYSFGDFDILAVNMHPSSGSWREFRYTVASWLLARPADTGLIEIFQPVATTPNDVWTDDLGTCLSWYEGARPSRVLTELLHRKKKAEKHA